MTQRIEPVGPRRDLAPVDGLRILTPVERQQEKQRREERRRRAAKKPPREGGTPGVLDVRA